MANPIPPEQKSDPTFKKYHLNCRVKFFNTVIDEDIGKGKRSVYPRKLVFLVPEESDECYRFYNAWVPQTQEEHFELAAIIGSPVNSPCRLSVHTRDLRNPKPYMVMMSKGIEDVIVNNIKEGQLLQVTTLPANEIDEAERAADVSQGNFKVHT